MSLGTETIRRVITNHYQGCGCGAYPHIEDDSIALMDLRSLLFWAKNIDDMRAVLLEYRDLTRCGDLFGEFAMDQDIFTDLDDYTVAIASDATRWLALRGNEPVFVAR